MRPRLQPICSKDGVTNFYSPCHAGCSYKSVYSPVASDPTQNVIVYHNCSCVREAWDLGNTSLSRDWIKIDYDQDFAASQVIDMMEENIRYYSLVYTVPVGFYVHTTTIVVYYKYLLLRTYILLL